MHNLVQKTWETIRKGDVVLLILCLFATGFGCLMIASATNAVGYTRYVTIQIIAACIGVALYLIVSSIDVEFISEHRTWLVLINVAMILALIPFGTDNGTGNRSWIPIPIIGIYAQPAEICKILFVLIMASVMASHQNRPSHLWSVVHLALHAGGFVLLNLVISKDLGVTMIFVFVFIVMAFTGGISVLWFLISSGALVVCAPVIWNNFLDGYQRNRLEVLINPALDPNGTGVRYHAVRSLRSLVGGGLTGQGLFNGTRTQTKNLLFAQHTDFIFSAIGEETGFIGCLFVMVLLFAIVIRVVWVGSRSQDYMRRMICFGSAAALIFQILINVAMCIGVGPVIGLTLPFISYGGSSLISLYAMLGLVSGVYARPAPTSHERYIRPPLASPYH